MTVTQTVNDEAPEVVVDRARRARYTLLDSMWVEEGTLEDWEELKALHYKDSGSPTGSVVWRCVTEEGALVGVTLLTTCTLLLAPRHRVFPKLKPGGDSYFTNAQRAIWLNNNMRRASRVVTDTLYRGGGVGYRMLNLAMRMSGYRYIEIQSSMSKYNPFDQKAGFRHAHLKSQRFYEEGLTFFRGLFDAHPADHQAIMEEFKSLPVKIQRGIDAEMRKKYFKWSPREKTGGSLGKGESRIEKMPLPQLLKEMQQLVFASPAYGIWENPDWRRTDLPKRIPLRAFDLQAPGERLKWSPK